MQEASDAHSKTADSDTVSTYQVSSVQLVTDNLVGLVGHNLVTILSVTIGRQSCRSPTALKRPDRSKQCNCGWFDICCFIDWFEAVFFHQSKEFRKKNCYCQQLRKNNASLRKR